MNKLLYIVLIFLISCDFYTEPKDYQSVRTIWTDKNGNKLLYCFSHLNAFTNKIDWIYEFHCPGEINYYKIKKSKEIGHRFRQSYYRDSLILFHEDVSFDMDESEEHWSEIDSTSMRPANKSSIPLSELYLKSKTNGVYKLVDSTLVKVCSYQSDSDWVDIKHTFGPGLYYFGPPGMFYKEKLDLKALNRCD